MGEISRKVEKGLLKSCQEGGESKFKKKKPHPINGSPLSTNHTTVEERSCNFDVIWFQLDGATIHTTRVTMDILRS